jgi:hypothetical protein
MKNLSTNLLFNKAIFLFLISIPVILICLPASFFDKGQTICLITLLTNQHCYACGMTRAIMHLIHLDTDTAFAYNMLSFIVLPLLIILWVIYLIKTYKKIQLLRSRADK